MDYKITALMKMHVHGNAHDDRYLMSFYDRILLDETVSLDEKRFVSFWFNNVILGNETDSIPSVKQILKEIQMTKEHVESQYD